MNIIFQINTVFLLASVSH